ncbi:unnamed protein product [Parnassius mnemosyne]|uniref:Uncharacterized protein n=1 Tax=Parnassius mnemosyne TaxID=213953 RepID=A0AAV1KA35_9NEOP
MKKVLLLLMVTCSMGQQNWVPCSELNDDLRYPCRCKVQVDRALQLGILMNCDRVVFAGDYPPLPYGAPIVSFSQRWAGQQSLPTQIFSSYGLPLKELDFSHNSLRRLPDRLLSGVRGNITRLALADNLLGDNLNPIFSTTEFHNLPALEELDLSGNSIRGLEEGLLIGCDVLKL